MQGPAPLGFSVWSIAKLFIVFGFIVYAVFAGVVVKQVQVMADTLSLGFENYLKLISILHLILSLAVLVLALVIL